MNKLVKKDFKKRVSFKKIELYKVILKSITLNSNYLKFIKWNSLFMLSRFLEKKSKTRIVDRCVCTGRKSKFNGSFKFSRLVFLKLSRLSLISGVKKSSW